METLPQETFLTTILVVVLVVVFVVVLATVSTRLLVLTVSPGIAPCRRLVAFGGSRNFLPAGAL